MKKYLLIICVIMATLLIGASISLPINAKNLEIIEETGTETVIITTNFYRSLKPQTVKSEFTEDEILEIIDIITNLKLAIESNDENQIQIYQELLENKGIFGNKNHDFCSYDKFEETFKSYKRSNIDRLISPTQDDNLSNSFCYFNAIGQGVMVSQIGIKLLEAFQRLLRNASSYIEAFVIIIIFLPFVLTAIVLTGLIPFRIMLREGLVYVETGSISSLGLNGYKKVDVDTEPISVNLSWFTGLTISIPGNEDTGRDAFLFTSGFAVQVYESDI